jgi:cell division protein FtsZ
MRSVLDKAVEKAREEKMAKQLEGDSDLLKVLEHSKAKIKVFGVGGAGGNTLSRLKTMNIAGVELCNVNTDAQCLVKIDSDKEY